MPNDDALAALGLHAPICELKAGCGYWSALLRARGVECACYDDDDEGEGEGAGGGGDDHSRFTPVARGGAERAAEHASSHTLLVISPHATTAAAAAAGAAGEQPAWDAAALASFVGAGGTAVAHVGELDLPVTALDGLGTTSRAFRTELRDKFEKQVSVSLPNWPAAQDELTIWRKKPAGAAAGAPVLDVKLELVDLEGPEWAKSDTKADWMKQSPPP